jgi:hypothetical protein
MENLCFVFPLLLQVATAAECTKVSFFFFYFVVFFLQNRPSPSIQHVKHNILQSDIKMEKEKVFPL